MNEYQKLKEIRSLLKEAYDHYFKNSEDGHCKKEEGKIAVYFGNYWEDEHDLEIRNIEIYSYVLGPQRLHSFDNIDEALSAVKEWHRKEMNTNYE